MGLAIVVQLAPMAVMTHFVLNYLVYILAIRALTLVHELHLALGYDVPLLPLARIIAPFHLCT